MYKWVDISCIIQLSRGKYSDWNIERFQMDISIWLDFNCMKWSQLYELVKPNLQLSWISRKNASSIMQLNSCVPFCLFLGLALKIRPNTSQWLLTTKMFQGTPPEISRGIRWCNKNFFGKFVCRNFDRKWIGIDWFRPY